MLLALEITLAETERNSVPELCLAAQSAATLPVHARLARLHRWDVTKRKLPRKPVSIEIGSSVDLWTALKHEYICSEISKPG